MTLALNFVLISEGSSDTALLPHLEQLCVLHGADDVSGAPYEDYHFPKIGKTTEARVGKLLEYQPNVDLIFIHRDSDSRDGESRYTEVRRSMSGFKTPYVSVVPIQETEAWALLDEKMIRQVAQNPRGKVPLNLPLPSKIETLASPKEHLKEVLVQASELSGRKLEKFKAQFAQQRRRLLENLDSQGPVRQLKAWQRLNDDVQTVIGNLKAD